MPFNTLSFPARYAVLGAALALSVPLAGLLSGAQAVPPRQKPPAQRTGEQMYRQLCVSCHGAKGEGTKQHNRALSGDRSVGELARFIAQYMPPGAPQKMPAGDAQKVAAYVHGAFYSPLARSRNKPARIDLSRLTVRQYRSTLADLVGSFRPARPAVATSGPNEPQQGLRGEYFKTGRLQRGQATLERVDPEIRFDFANAGALAQQDDPYQFGMRWEGSVLAPDTGEYEFIVRTEHGTRLWINDLQKPLVDALVKSGSGSEHRASIFLLRGRLYPLRLEFSKGVQGVNNLKKLKEKPPQKASIALEWKRPHLAAQVIPQRSLFPTVSPETFVARTPFPPDDRSVGYERGASVSKAWAEATTEAAIEAADYVATHLRELGKVADDAADRDVKVRAFCRRFVEQAFRQPISNEMAAFFVDQQFQSAPDEQTAVKRVVLLTLKSPRFLYQEIVPGGAPDSYNVASRLSFALWDSLPDEELLQAAAANQLSTREQVARQAERMVGDELSPYRKGSLLSSIGT